MAEDLETQGARLKAEMLKHVADRQCAIVLTLEDKLIAPPPLGTPVDTHNAQNNWIMSVGDAFQGTDGDNKAPSHVVQDRSFSEIAAYAQTVRRASQLQPLHITNNEEYITRLNAGSSEQSPAGFVEAAIEQTLVEVNEQSNDQIQAVIRRGPPGGGE